MSQYEKLGAFYLGTENRDLDGDGRADFMLMDSRDLVTHAMCVGMTGSGKTGLGICLLEEAAMDGIPAIVVDPKGDMGNLLLSFPDLLPSDFAPWVHPEEAERSGLTVEQLAEKKASVWRQGLAASMQDGERIRVMHRNAEFALYTPGGSFGRPLSLEGMFRRPLPATMEDGELFQSVVSTTATSLLHLAGIQADPVTSREHVFLSLLIRKAWQEGQDFDLASLIHWISNPPVRTIGVMDIEMYLPQKDRFDLALRFNNLIASPSFAAFMEGDPFDIPSLLYTPQGKPKISILSIAHLADAERMFFVSLLLNRLVAWMRTEQGTSSLRALFYMDEVFGYFPPVAKPPSKEPLLTLLKTARAYGLGIVLSTQNPGDIDYKGLSNIGTWFVGRLTTERDRMRLIEGMADEARDGMTQTELGSVIAGLNPRKFLMRSAGEARPVLFQTRFCMSYLAGPLTRDQIRRLTYGKGQSQPSPAPYTSDVPGSAVPYTPAPQAPFAPAPTPFTHEEIAAPAPYAPPSRPEQEETQASRSFRADIEQPSYPSSSSGDPVQSARPAAVYQDAENLSANGYSTVVPAAPQGVSVSFVHGAPGSVYCPYLAGFLSIYYADAKKGVSSTETVSRFAPLTESVVTCDWNNARDLGLDLKDLMSDPPAGARFGALPADARRKTSFTAWERALTDTVWRGAALTLRRHQDLGLFSGPEESESEFKARVTMAAREKRDAALDVIRGKYEKKRRTLEDKMARAEEKVERTKDQAKDARRQSAISIGSAILGGLLGRKVLSASTVYRGSTAVKSVSRAHRTSGNVGRAEDSYERVEEELALLEKDMKEDLETAAAAYDGAADAIDTIEIRPLKRDVVVNAFTLVWVPEA